MQLGPYTLVARIARGRRADVWRAESLWGQQVAIKALASDAEDRHEATDALILDGRRRRGLVHPGITQVLDQGVVPAGHEVLPVGSPWLALEYAPGGTLDGLGPLEEREVVRLAWRLLDALAYVHARGVVHLDVKASNVLVWRDESGELWPSLTDFGTLSGEGTRRYAAPEQQVRGGAVGPWTDLYGLGCLLVRLLAGRLPEEPPAWVEGHPPVSSPFRAWLGRLLEPLRADRFRSAADAAWALYGDHPDLPPGPCWSWAAPASSTRAPLPVSVNQGPWERPGAPERLPGLGGVMHGRAPMVARRDERARVWEALRAAESGRGPRVVLVGGGAGLGKSRMLRWVSARLREYGRHGVIHVRAREGQAARATVRELEQQRAAVESGVFAPPRGQGEREGVRQERAPGEDASARTRAFMKWVASYTVDRPLALIVDDVHHCPELWSLVDEVLAGEVRALCLVFSGTDASGSERWSEARDARGAHGHVSCLELEPLGTEASLELLKGRLHLEGAEARRSVAEALGNPGRLIANLKERVSSHRYILDVEGCVRVE